MDFFFITLFSLFSIVDPPGVIPVYLALTGNLPQRERNRVALYTSFYFLIILVSFFWAGSYILSFFGLTIHAFRIAGGLTLMVSGIGLMYGEDLAKRRSSDGAPAFQPEAGKDIAFSPLAMPLLSGPGSISFLITQYKEHPVMHDRLYIFAAIVAVGLLVWVCLRLAPFLFKVLGNGGLKAIARVMGFIVIALGAQLIVDGVVHLVQQVRL
jgi:multiple antibiotic resistance protein